MMTLYIITVILAVASFANAVYDERIFSGDKQETKPLFIIAVLIVIFVPILNIVVVLSELFKKNE